MKEEGFEKTCIKSLCEILAIVAAYDKENH